MPRASHEPTLARQWELLKLLPSRHPGKTARELCERLDAAGHAVTKRTVERDLTELSRIFPLLRNEISQPYGWYLRPGAQIDFPGIDLAEAVSLGLLEDLLRQLVPPTFMESLEGRFTEAREKLKALPQNAFSKWADVVRYISPGLPLPPPSIKPDVLRAVQDALLQRCQLKVSYTSAGATAAKELVLHPIALIQQGERSYLLASTYQYDTLIQYAIHRIHAAELLAERAKRPKSFSLDTFLAQGGAQFGQGATIALKAHLSEALATILRETALSPDQQITTRAGKNTLTATVKDSWQLHFWILSQGPFVTVLQPSSLRKQIVSQLKAALSNY